MNRPPYEPINSKFSDVVAFIIFVIAMIGIARSVQGAEYVALVDEYEPVVTQQIAPPSPQYEIVINKSTYMLKVFRDGELVEERKAIVGRKGRRTPTLETEFNLIGINPTWDVPTSLVGDVVRKVKSKKDPVGYFTRLKYRMIDKQTGNQIDPYTIDWKTISSKGPYSFDIKQDPGPLNMLGPVMFYLENTGGVQMHGTSTPALFNNEKREFSSGCIRVDGAFDLAAMLLNQTPEQLGKIVDNKWLRLDNSVKVKVVD